MQSNPKKSAKPGKFVPSRYKEAAKMKAVPKTNSPFPTGNSGLNTNSSNMLKTPKFGSGVKIKDCTSTPCSSNTSVPKFDASAIVADQSSIPALEETHSSVPVAPLAIKKKPHSNVRRGPIIALDGPQKKDDKDDAVRELEMDLLYARYVQALFLESEAKRSYQERAKNSLKCLYKLFLLNQKIQQEEHAYAEELVSLALFESLLKFHEETTNLLGPLYDDLSVLIPQYANLVAAVEPIKDKLYAPNLVFNPEEVEVKIKEIAESLKAFIGTFEEESHRLAETTESALKIVQLKDDAEDVLNECFKLFTITDYLTMKESSFKIADMQLNDSGSR